jgi:hypothetical protein
VTEAVKAAYMNARKFSFLLKIHLDLHLQIPAIFPGLGSAEKVWA